MANKDKAKKQDKAETVAFLTALDPVWAALSFFAGEQRIAPKIASREKKKRS